MTKTKHGGKRPNSGRKKEYSEETTTIAFRVPVSLVDHITEYVRNLLDNAKISKNDV